MAWIQSTLFCLLLVVALSKAQWRGSLGGTASRRDWRLNGRLTYQRRNTNFYVGGHYGRGNSWGASVGFKWKFGRKRRGADVTDDTDCSQCVTVLESQYKDGLAKLDNPFRVDYAILADLDGIYSSDSDDVLSFRIDAVLREPTNFNSTNDKEFDIFAKRPACPSACLKVVKSGTYLIGGSILNGQMIIYDTLVHLLGDKNGFGGAF